MLDGVVFGFKTAPALGTKPLKPVALPTAHTAWALLTKREFCRVSAAD